MAQNQQDYMPGEIVPFPTRPWPPANLPPCYLPQPTNYGICEDPAKRMLPIINKYSSSKYSTEEWQHHNAVVLEGEPLRRSDEFEIRAKNCMTHVYGLADKTFNCSTNLLKNRAHEIYQWKCETEYCIKSMTDEIVELEELRQRLKAATAILDQPEEIAKECLQLRLNRLDTDLVHDTSEDELNQEIQLISDIRRLYWNTLADIEIQLKNNKAAKARVEFDWSDKVNSYDTDSCNIALNRQTCTILMKPGAVRVPEEQSTPSSWQLFTRHNLEAAESCRRDSINLRKYVEATILNAARDLKTKAGRVDQALAAKAACTDDLRIRLEDELRETLQRLTMVERMSEELKDAQRKMEICTKLTQTRLDNRNPIGRPNVENCRDAPQAGLLDEAKSLTESMHALNDQLYNANVTRVKLLKSRGELEKEIYIKKKSLSIDGDRCKTVRSLYPSAAKLSGLE